MHIPRERHVTAIVFLLLGITVQAETKPISIVDTGTALGTSIDAPITDADLGGLDFTAASKLVVTVGLKSNGFPENGTVSLSYGGRPMELAVEATSEQPLGYAGIFYLDEPTAPGDLVITSKKGRPYSVGVTAIVLTGTLEGHGARSSAAAMTASLRTIVDDTFVVAAYTDAGGSNQIDAVQAPLTELLRGGRGSGSQASGYQQLAEAATVTPSFDGDSATRSALAAVAFRPVTPIKPFPAFASLAPGGEVELKWINLAPTTGKDVWVDVWFGTDPDALTQVVSAADGGRNLVSHRVDAPELGSYFWRVDSYLRGGPSGTPKQGTVFEFVVIDTDADGLPDIWETEHFGGPTVAQASDDPDKDGLSNLGEYQRGTDPKQADTDEDGLSDKVETDTGIWAGPGDTGTNPLNPDSDGDGLLDGAESNTGKWKGTTDTGTDPLNPDSDGDGLLDGAESRTGQFAGRSQTGTDPLVADSDGDGANDWYEVYGPLTDPNDVREKPVIPHPLPRPDNTATPASDKPVKVFILSGQSNMVGISVVKSEAPGSLDTITKREGKFPYLLDEDGEYLERRDVWYEGVVTATAKKWLAPGCGNNPNSIGPELGFGHVMGWYHDEPVLIIKASQGNRGLGWDIRPPGSQGFQWTSPDGVEYSFPAYGQAPSRWITGEGGPVQAYSWYCGKQFDEYFLDEADRGGIAWAPGVDYRDNSSVRRHGWTYNSKAFHTSTSENGPQVDAEGQPVASENWSVYSGTNVTDVLDNFAEKFPQWADQGFEIAGYAWWQGHWDQQEPHASRYEKNLARLIREVRAYYEKRYPGKVVPEAPFAVATIGFGGQPFPEGSPSQKVHAAQLAIADPEAHPEFAGNVKSVDTMPYWRELDQSPGAQGFHYNNNAETYMLVGDALARLILEMKAD